MRIAAPRECTVDDLRAFATMVREGGQVDPAGLEARILKAAWLGLFSLDGELAAVAALKVPRPSYQQGVFSKARVPDQSVKFQLEFGWLVVAPKYRRRGLATALVRALLMKNPRDGVFATTVETNKAVGEILKNEGFESLGQAFRSARGETSINLWVRYPDISCLGRCDLLAESESLDS